MSLVNPGGQRRLAEYRIFGFENIRRAIKERLKGRDHRRRSRGSIATLNRWTGLPHGHERAIARRLRQKASFGA